VAPVFDARGLFQCLRLRGAGLADLGLPDLGLTDLRLSTIRGDCVSRGRTTTRVGREGISTSSLSALARTRHMILVGPFEFLGVQDYPAM
jgi:hypothetical protein